MKSILQTERECYLCRTPFNLEKHHIFAGPNRNSSEKYGCFVLLCAEHHRGSHGVHRQILIDKRLRQEAQIAFEKTHTHEEFMEIFGRSYL